MKDRHDPDDDLEIRIPRINGHSPATVNPVPPPASQHQPASKKYIATGGYGSPHVRDWFFFSLELETALNAGVSFIEAIRLIAASSPKKAIRRSAEIILFKLKEGGNLAAALSHAREIPNLIRNLLIVGIRGGNTSEALRQVVEHYNWLLEIRSRILRAITYPAMLVILGTAVMIGRDTAVASLTNKMSTEEALLHYTLHYSMPILLGALIAVIIAWVVYTPAVRPYFDRIILTAPVVGKIVKHYSLAVFYRVLAVLTKAGLPITDGWILASQSVPNHHLGQQMQVGLRYLQDGEPLSEALKHAQMTDSSGKAMAAVGETAGDTSTLLRKYSDYRTEQLRNKVVMLTALLGPIALGFVFLGYFVNVGALTCLAFLIVLIRRLI